MTMTSHLRRQFYKHFKISFPSCVITELCNFVSLIIVLICKVRKGKNYFFNLACINIFGGIIIFDCVEGSGASMTTKLYHIKVIF